MTTPRRIIEAPGMRIQFLIEGHETNDSISIFRCDFEAGARGPMPHSHDRFDNTVYGVSGTVTEVVDEVPHRLGPGDVLHVPRGVVHRTVIKEAATVLAISTPGLFGYAYLVEMADALNAAGDGPPDRELLNAIQKRNGITPAPASNTHIQVEHPSPSEESAGDARHFAEPSTTPSAEQERETP